MYLNRYRREEVGKIFVENFEIPKRVFFKLLDEFALYVKEDDRTFIYNVHYLLHDKKDVHMTQNMLRAIVKTFVFLYEDASDKYEIETVKERFNLLFEILFIQRCYYSQKVEEQAKTAQKILFHTTERLSETLETQELMIANISHEMRTSLNVIYGYLRIIDEKNILKGEDLQFLHKANHATLTLKSLVSDILNVTKLNSGQLEIQEEYFWIDEMLMQCIDNISLELQKKNNVRLETSIPFLPFKVYGDKVHIMEIVVNLLSNAVKYTDKGVVLLEVSYEERNGEHRVCFSVQDTGIGMNPEQIKQIFSPYSRFKTERQGLGLGLHIAYELAKRLNGSLKVESTFGEGSRFEFHIVFDKVKNQTLSLKGKQFCFFMEKSKYEKSEERFKFLEENGVNIDVFYQETEFINFLLTLGGCNPDMIFISAEKEGYAKFDALIYYLKTLPQYKKTIFVGEDVAENLSLNFFDIVYERMAPATVYEKLIEKRLYVSQKKQGKISLLVIDDTETNLDIFKLFVSKHFPNITIDLAGGGYEGVGMFKIKKYDIIFIDLKMPGLNGFEVLEKLKKLGEIPPVYAFSADVYKSNFEKVEEYGFTGMVEKPLQPEKLFKILQKVIDAKYNR